MGNCLPRKSTGIKDSNTSTPLNSIVKPEEKPVPSKKKIQTAPSEVEADKSKSRRKCDDGINTHNLNTPTKTSSLHVEAGNDFQGTRKKGNSTTANLEGSGKQNESKNDKRSLDGRPCTASSVFVEVNAVPEKSEPDKNKRHNNRGTTGGWNHIFSVPKTKEEARFEDGRTKEDETVRVDGTSDLNESKKDTRNQFPAPRNKNVDNIWTSGNSKLDESLNDLGPSHSRNVEDEEERNRSQKAEPCMEGSHIKPIKPPKKRRRIKELEAQVKILIEEKNSLLNRLSEIGAMKLIDNNPNITDLSDANRPEKLVEQLSELYDNEWTDAYEHLTKTQGQNVIQSVNLLLQALKETYNICLSSTKEKAITLRKAMLSYAGLSDEDPIEIELREIEKKMWEYRTNKSQCNVSRVGKEVRERMRDQLKQLETKPSNSVSLYIDGCVRICWYMCIKTPPIHLDFGENEKTTTADNGTSAIRYFNKTKFMSYTKDGEYIDYVVWPAVFLHDGGSIMRKGVAQGGRVIINTLVDIK